MPALIDGSHFGFAHWSHHLAIHWPDLLVCKQCSKVETTELHQFEMLSPAFALSNSGHYLRKCPMICDLVSSLHDAYTRMQMPDVNPFQFKALASTLKCRNARRQQLSGKCDCFRCAQWVSTTGASQWRWSQDLIGGAATCTNTHNISIKINAQLISILF